MDLHCTEEAAAGDGWLGNRKIRVCTVFMHDNEVVLNQSQGERERRSSSFSSPPKDENELPGEVCSFQERAFGGWLVGRVHTRLTDQRPTPPKHAGGESGLERSHRLERKGE